jgi:hypothetical protein
MGLLESLVEHASAKSVLILLPGLLLAYMLVAVIVRPAWQELKLARMPGARAPRIKSVLPFGECEPLGGWRDGPLANAATQALTFCTRASAGP